MNGLGHLTLQVKVTEELIIFLYELAYMMIIDNFIRMIFTTN